MKVVFDTNVLISAFLTTTGPSQSVFTAALKRHTVVLSEYILKEFEKKLVGKLRMPVERVRHAVDFLRRRVTVLDISGKKDLPLLALLETAQAHYFVTGDKKLLELKKHKSALFLTPREAMEISK